MQKECSANYPKGIGVGDIAVTRGYKLSCKKVYHVAVDSYERDRGCLKVTGLLTFTILVANSVDEK